MHGFGPQRFNVLTFNTVVQNEVQVKQNISLAVHTSSETSVRYVSETVDEKIWHWDLLESWKNMALLVFLAFFGVFGCHFHSAVLFPQVFGTAYDIYPPQTSAWHTQIPSWHCQTPSDTIQTPIRHPHIWPAWGHWEKKKYIFFLWGVPLGSYHISIIGNS